MSEPSQLDKVFNVIMQHMVKTGQAPFYTEIASELGLSVEEGRKALHDLFKAGVPGWLFPGTDYITSFAPFNHLPTQYQITIDNQQKWYGQWAFESLAVCWLFPGKKVLIETPCLDCGEPIVVEMRDGEVLRAEPKGLVGYVAVPFRKWFENIPYAWSTMTLFRSEEHVRNWSGFKPATEERIIPLDDLVTLFSGNYFRRRLDDDWVSRSREYTIEIGKEFAKRGPFWQLPRK